MWFPRVQCCLRSKSVHSLGTRKASLAMYFRWLDEFPAERLCSARIYLDIRPSYGPKDSTRVVCSVPLFRITIARGDSEKLQARVSSCKKYGKDILMRRKLGMLQHQELCPTSWPENHQSRSTE